MLIRAMHPTFPHQTYITATVATYVYALFQHEKAIIKPYARSYSRYDTTIFSALLSRIA